MSARTCISLHRLPSNKTQLQFIAEKETLFCLLMYYITFAQKNKIKIMLFFFSNPGIFLSLIGVEKTHPQEPLWQFQQITFLPQNYGHKRELNGVIMKRYIIIYISFVN